MKKISILLMVAFMSIMSGRTQDTVHLNDMRLIENLFVSQWPDTFPYNSMFGAYTVAVISLGEDFPSYEQTAYRMYTDDTLTVYGLAGGFSSQYRYDHEYYAAHPSMITGDTSCTNSRIFMRLYEADMDSLRFIGEEKIVHLDTTPISYYVDLGLGWSNLPWVRVPPIPMYERYFSTPVTVADSFYVGLRYRDTLLDGAHVITLSVMNLGMLNSDALYHDVIDPKTGDTVWVWTYWPEHSWPTPFLFPIIAPPDTTWSPSDTTWNPSDTTWHPSDTVVSGGAVVHPGNTIVVFPGDTIVISGDTIVNLGDTLFVHPGDTLVLNSGDTLVINVGDTLFASPGDTLFILPDGTIVANPGGTIVVSPSGTPGTSAIAAPELVYRYTAVMPNPATGKVRVTSSFGLSRIEAFDAQGRLVYNTTCPPALSASLDVSSWPRGSYLLRIHTPAGTTTKKLLVQ